VRGYAKGTKVFQIVGGAQVRLFEGCCGSKFRSGMHPSDLSCRYYARVDLSFVRGLETVARLGAMAESHVFVVSIVYCGHERSWCKARRSLVVPAFQVCSDVRAADPYRSGTAIVPATFISPFLGSTLPINPTPET
jgi:hypothetical protein